MAVPNQRRLYPRLRVFHDELVPSGWLLGLSHAVNDGRYYRHQWVLGRHMASLRYAAGLLGTACHTRQYYRFGILDRLMAPLRCVLGVFSAANLERKYCHPWIMYRRTWPPRIINTLAAPVYSWRWYGKTCVASARGFPSRCCLDRTSKGGGCIRGCGACGPANRI